MPRARNIKYETFQNEFLGQMSSDTVLVFIGLWTLADALGRLEDRPEKIKGQLFAFRPPEKQVDVEACLNELASSPEKFICRYATNDLRLIQITHFEKHQNIHPKEKTKGSKYPSPDSVLAGSNLPAQKIHGQSVTSNLPVQLNSEYLNIEYLNSEQKTLVDKPTKEIPSKKQESEHFDQFWKIYPRKVNRLGTLAFWTKNNLDQEAETIIASVQRHSMCEQWKAQNGQFIPHPLTFLRQERYLDFSMDVPSIGAIPANALLDEKRAKRDALLKFPFIRLEGSLVESSRFSVDDAFPDRLYAFGCSYDISLLEGVSANE